MREYESKVVKKADLILTVSENDEKVYKDLFRIQTIKYLPVFTPWNNIISEEGTGQYCLYHGNLSINENEAVALWLAEKVFNNINTPLIIAGRHPSPKLISAGNQKVNVTVIANPSEEKMEELIRSAQINILPSFSNTGIKLKLLHALFCGRHCLVNNMMVENTGLENTCTIAAHATDFQNMVQSLFQKPFTKEEIYARQQIISTIYNNGENARQLTKLIYS